MRRVLPYILLVVLVALGISTQAPTFAGSSGASGSQIHPKGYIEGLGLEYVSATTINVLAGSARSAANDNTLTLAATVVPDITAVSSFSGAGTNGLDVKTSAQTATTHGTATFEPGASVISELNTRSLTGTLSAVATAVTGVGTLFLTEISVGDLIGSTTTYGFSRVTAIASNTACTLVVAFPGGDPSGISVSAAENAIVRIAAETPQRVSTISAAGTSVVVPSAWTSNTTGVTIAWGGEIVSAWYAVWLITDGTDTLGMLSTQRTTPYLAGIAGKRRVGWVRNDGSGDISAFRSVGFDRTRFFTAPNAAGISNGSATTYTDVDFSSAAPPTARVLRAPVLNNNVGGAAEIITIKSRGDNDLTEMVGGMDAGQTRLNNMCPCDGAQYIQYKWSTTDAGAYIYCNGYYDDL